MTFSFFFVSPAIAQIIRKENTNSGQREPKFPFLCALGLFLEDGCDILVDREN